ncbi:MAG TPA: hypothetical protein VJ417_03880, partial [Candidatus Glassbacteria bacterium]|nr:hypothetical protein [Candidatus Glassbacteria bacterium]
NVPVTSSDTFVGVITTSPVVFTGGNSAVNTAFDPQGAGTATIAVGTPAGFDIPSSFRQITATVTAPNINIISNVTVGKDLQTSVFISLGVAPPNPVNVTVTSSNPAIAILSTSATTVGSNSVTFSGVTSTSVGTIIVQGIGRGSTILTAQAPGYNDATPTVTVDPSGFVINSPSSINTTASAANVTIQIASALLNPTTLNRVTNQAVRAGLAVNVPVTSSNPAVGTITVNPVAFAGGSSSVNTAFDPLAAGTTTIAVGTPVSTPPVVFDTPSNLQQITATVN